MTGVAIRRATPADARAVARVHVETWRAAYAGILPDRVMLQMTVDDKAASWRRSIGSQGARDAVLAAVATWEGVVGFASCGPAAAGPAGFAGEVYTLYVLPDWQEQGVGRALLGASFAALRAAGLGSALIWVLADNPSRFFYEAMGGTRVGERDETLWGVVLHEAAYGWPDLAALPPAK